jgi:hypothetical protein
VQVTINEDTTFFITDELGDATADNEQGLYYEDTRFLSVYQLHLNGHELRVLTARTLEHYHAVHLLSNPVGEVLAPETLTIARHRLVGQGLHEDIEVTSHLDKPLVLVLELRVAADFLHIFQVRGHSRDGSGASSTAGACASPTTPTTATRRPKSASRNRPSTPRPTARGSASPSARAAVGICASTSSR